MDNLNTHSLASRYEAYAPEVARRLAQRVAVHYPPKPGSWLTRAEIELSVLSRQCLDRQIGAQAVLEQEVRAWTQARNTKHVAAEWRFTTAAARIKLKHLYPSLQE